MQNTFGITQFVSNVSVFLLGVSPSLPPSGAVSPSHPTSHMAATGTVHVGGCVLDHASRLSHSLVWEWQSSFYSNAGIAAWSDSIVPNFVTTNRWIANEYGRILLGFLNDVTSGPYRKKWNQTQPIYFIELGAGHGRFSYLILDALVALEEFWPRRDSAHAATAAAAGTPLFTYIMTDFAQDHLDFWRAHPRFKRFLARGLVQFGLFDAEDPGGGIRIFKDTQIASSATSTPSTTSSYDPYITLQPGMNSNPVGVIANYVFDTLRHDAFRMVPKSPISSRRSSSVSERESTTTTAPPTSSDSTSIDPSTSDDPDAPCTLQLQESLLTLTSPHAYEPDSNDPTLLKRFGQVWTYRDIPNGKVRIGEQGGEVTQPPTIQYYTGSDAPFNTVLSQLVSRCANFPSAHDGFSFLVPIGAMRCLRWLSSFACSNLMCLVGDKAHSSLSELVGSLREPHLAIHGSFSMMVNFECLRHMFQEYPSGAAVWTPYLDGFKVGLFTRMRIAEKDERMSEEMEQVRERIAQMRKEVAAAAASSTSPSLDDDGSIPSSSSSSSSSLSLLSSCPASSTFGSNLLLSRILRDTLFNFTSLNHFTPDSFSTLQRCMKEETSQASLKYIISLLRLSKFDSEVFWKFRTQILERVSAIAATTAAAAAAGSAGGLSIPPQSVSEKMLKDLRFDLQRIHEGWFPLRLGIPPYGNKDVSFELGRLSMGLHEYGMARRFFLASIAECGRHHVTEYNLGLCRNYEGEYESALRHFETALQLHPDYVEAREWCERMKIRVVAEAIHTTNVQARRVEPTLSQATIMASIQQHQQQQQQHQQQQHRLSNSDLHPVPSVVGGGLSLPFPSTASSSLPFPSTSVASAIPHASAHRQTSSSGSIAPTPAPASSSSDHPILNTFVQTYRGYN